MNWRVRLAGLLRRQERGEAGQPNYEDLCADADTLAGLWPTCAVGEAFGLDGNDTQGAFLSREVRQLGGNFTECITSRDFKQATRILDLIEDAAYGAPKTA